ncbi:Uncharacterized protein HZ326_0396 [Fusarium oxysporum f. sp. albedinis]|nr:Uncharacterized protein HZ326_0396 [Fusarium oxysporum f. sp. albedinis]
MPAAGRVVCLPVVKTGASLVEPYMNTFTCFDLLLTCLAPNFSEDAVHVEQGSGIVVSKDVDPGRGWSACKISRGLLNW